MSDKIQTENFPNSTISQAVVGCHDRPWCTCICQQVEGNHILTDLYVIRDYVEAKSGNKLQCYTVQWRRLLFPSQGSSITGTEHVLQSLKVISNLADGIYNRNMTTCYFTHTAQAEGFPYILVELTEVALVSGIKFRVQPHGNIDKKNKDLKVLVGDETSSTHFSDYRLLGTYQGPPTAYDIDIEISGSPLVGKYVLVQEVTSTTSSQIQICTLEIF